MTMYRRGDMTPWAERALTPEEQARVRASQLTSLAGRTPRGPWTAAGPGGVHKHADIRRAVNLAAGKRILEGGSDAG